MHIMASAKSHASVRFILPSGAPSPTLKLASSGATNRGRWRQLVILRGDQALLATGSVRFEEEIPVPRASLPHYFTHSLPHYLRRRFAAHSLTLSFSPTEPRNSPVSTRRSIRMIPQASRLLTRLIYAVSQALRDKLGGVVVWSWVGVSELVGSVRTA